MYLANQPEYLWHQTFLGRALEPESAQRQTYSLIQTFEVRPEIRSSRTFHKNYVLSYRVFLEVSGYGEPV
jgi:hypothetical protein